MKEEVLPFFIEDLQEKTEVKVHATPLLVSFDEPSVIICSSSAVIQKKSNRYEIVSQKENQHYTPDIDILLTSFANFTHALDIEVLIMTGIGRDGTEGAKLLKSKGAKIYAQDEQSSPVFGMPKSVIESGIVDKIKSFDEILKYFGGL
jgi:chemotaxis response regulator CheB